MYCSECGERIRKHHKFCPNCGKKVSDGDISEKNDVVNNNLENDIRDIVDVSVEEVVKNDTKRTKSPNRPQESARDSIIAATIILFLFLGGCVGCRKIVGSSSRERKTVFYYDMIDERTQTVDVFWGGDRPVTHITIKSGGITILSKPVNPPLKDGKIRIRKPYDNVGLEYDWRH